MNPTICMDKENILLISEPFSNMDKAQQFVDENDNVLDTLVPGKQFSVVELNDNSLPTFSQEQGIQEIASTPIGFRDDHTLSFEPLIINGRFLGYDRDNTEYIYAQPNVILGDQEGDSFAYEYLYKGDARKTVQTRLLENQFSSLNSAMFSYDSNYIAFIEQNDVLRTLQILSLVDGKLYVPAEDSFGIDTASFAWADDENVLYAILHIF